MNAQTRRIITAVVVSILCFGVNHYAQKVLNPFDPPEDSLISMSLLLGISLFAAFLLWAGKVRWGSIILLGCFPAMLYFIIDAQFLHPHYHISLQEASPVWTVAEYLAFLGVLLSQGVVAWTCVRVLRVGPPSISATSA